MDLNLDVLIFEISNYFTINFHSSTSASTIDSPVKLAALLPDMYRLLNKLTDMQPNPMGPSLLFSPSGLTTLAVNLKLPESGKIFSTYYIYFRFNGRRCIW